MPLSHDADTVVETLTDMIAGLPQDLRRTLTWDQGAEFADPHSPWQRGSNKNINGLLRDYFPKSTDLGTYPPEDLRRSPTPTQHPTPPTIQLKTPAKPIEQLPHNDAVALTT